MQPEEGRRHLCGPAAGSEPLVEVINLRNGPIRLQCRGVNHCQVCGITCATPTGLDCRRCVSGQKDSPADKLDHIGPEIRIDILRAAFKAISCNSRPGNSIPSLESSQTDSDHVRGNADSTGPIVSQPHPGLPRGN